MKKVFFIEIERRYSDTFNYDEVAYLQAREARDGDEEYFEGGCNNSFEGRFFEGTDEELHEELKAIEESSVEYEG